MPRISSTTGKSLTLSRPRNLPRPMIMKANASADGGNYYLKIGEFANVVIDWGDGATENVINTSTSFSGSTSHTYAAAGNYTVTITGFMPQFGVTAFGSDGRGQNFITEVVQWNSTTTDLSWAFEDEGALIAVPNTLPRGVTNAKAMFYGCYSLIGTGTSFWDVSTVTDMSLMFVFAYEFNQPLAAWDVSAVTNMDLMFNGAAVFNQDLSGWCVTNIPQLPDRFATDTQLAPANFPVWGTCPNG